MKLRNIVTAFVFSLVVLALIGFIASLDHSVDRNVPGSTTGAGKSALSGADPAQQEKPFTPLPRPATARE
jgi:hypothetical protein